MLNIFKLLKVGRKNVYMNNINIRFQVNGRGRQMTGTPRRKLLSPVPPLHPLLRLLADSWRRAMPSQCWAELPAGTDAAPWRKNIHIHVHVHNFYFIVHKL